MASHVQTIRLSGRELADIVWAARGEGIPQAALIRICSPAYSSVMPLFNIEVEYSWIDPEEES